MKTYIFILITCISFNLSNAQSSINDYKYVIVEDQFNFQKEPGQYNLNRLVQFLLRKHGFTPIIEGQELPADLKSNFCLALRADVIAKGALRTKATIILKDCESNEVYKSGEGITKEKDFARAYDLAIRKAFDTFNGLNYVYAPNQEIIDKGRPEEVTEVVEEAKKEIEELKAEIKELKGEKEVTKEEIAEKNEEIKKGKLDIVNKEDVKDSVTKVEKEHEVYEEKMQTGSRQEKYPDYIITQPHQIQVFYARKGVNGFNLFVKNGEEENILYAMHYTILNDVYFFEGEKKSGTIIKRENGDWLMENYDFSENNYNKREKIKIIFQ